MRKQAYCICDNKDADQLRGNREADQRLCFRYTDSTIPLLSKSKVSNQYPSSVAVQTGLCGTWSEAEDQFSHNEAHLGFVASLISLHCLHEETSSPKGNDHSPESQQVF